MHLHKWLARKKGRTAALAAHFGVTASSITQWESNGVPLVRMEAVRKFTGNAVTIEEMVQESHRLAKKRAAEARARAAAIETDAQAL